MTNDEFERLQVKKLEHLSFTELAVELNRLNNLEWPRHRLQFLAACEIINEIDRRLKVWSDNLPQGGWYSEYCPKCDKIITGVPALSRRDNDTYICTDCGTKEAMEDYFFSRRVVQEKH